MKGSGSSSKWETRSLKLLGKVVTGSTPSKKIDRYYGSAVPFITPGELNGTGEIAKAKIFLSEEGAKISRVIPPKSVLVTCIGTLGKVGYALEPLVTNQQINSIIFDNNIIEPRFGYFACKGLGKNMSRLAPATTVPIISKSKFESLEISYPPDLKEQRRIAAILDKADSIRRKRQEAIKMCDEFLRALFLDMFGDPVTNPKRWDSLPLGSLLTKIDSGWSPKCQNRPAESPEWGVLKLSAVTKCQFDPGENKALLETDRPRTDLEVKSGDLLFTRKNTYELVGACALVENTPDHLLLPDTIFRLRLNSDAAILPHFLWKFLTMESVRQEIGKLASGSAGSMPNISKERLKSLKILRPPLETQKKFSNIYRCTTRSLNRCLDFNLVANDLFNALSLSAFKGGL